jgi:cytochrome b pre-mRNA-processing protein 3
MLNRLLGLKRRPDDADALYGHAVTQARDARFYADLGVADRIDARFELYVLHVQLLILRLQEDGEAGRDLAQRLFDVFVSALDNDLRELGVGDLSVAKKMRKLSEHVYGRMSAYDAPLKDADAEALTAAVARNVGPGKDDGAGVIAAYALASRERLAAQDLAGIVRGPDWGELTR